MSAPTFDKEVEMLKITLLSDDLRTRAFTRIGFYLSLYVAFSVGVLALLQVTDRVEVASFGVVFAFGSFLYIPYMIRSSASDYYKKLQRVGELITLVQRGKTVGEFGDLLKDFIAQEKDAKEMEGTPEVPAQDPREEEQELRAEERRAVTLLGILAVVASVWAALWGKAQTQQDFFFNFPGNNVAHFTLYVEPFFEYLILYWVGYAASMYFYFSNDWFKGSKMWTFVRDLFHGIGQVFEGLYLLTVGYVVVLAGIGFNAPNEVQPIYWIFFPIGLVFTVLFVMSAAFGLRGSVMRLFRAIATFTRNL